MSDTYTDVVGERGEYRATITIDTSPEQPENDFGCPVLRVEPSGYGGGLVTSTGYGSHSAKQDGLSAGGIDTLQHFVSNHGWSDGIDIFGRYLAIYHGGSIERYSGQQWDDPTYVAYVTERMVRDAWGSTGPVPKAELKEWQAYCEGEVYSVAVERRLLKRTEYVTMDDRHPVDADEAEVWFEEADSVVGGYYGEQWAREAALEALDDYPGPNHEVFYASADGPHPLSTWSVYREEYLSPDEDEPIEGTTRRMSTWLNEEMAQAAVVRLQAGEI